MDDLDCNPFFLALQSKFRRHYEEAQNCNGHFFIPNSSALKDAEITEDFIKLHVIRPSPLFKGQFVNFFGGDQRVVEIEGLVVKKLTGFDDTSCINILGEEKGYTKDGKCFSIYLVDRPLEHPKQTKCSTGNKACELEIPNSWLDGSATASLSDCKRILQSLDNKRIFRSLEEKTSVILMNYLFLPDYLEEASQKLSGIVNKIISDILAETVLGMRVKSVLRTVVENYMMNTLHSRLFPVLCQKLAAEDEKLKGKLLELHTLDVTPEQLGAEEMYSCLFPASVVELACLDSLMSPREKLQCIKNTIDLISAELKQHLLETRPILYPPGSLPCLTTDNLIPLLLTVIVKARLYHLEADIFYLDNFLWSVSSKDALGYSFVTFKAAVEFLKNLDISLLTPAVNQLKKELSLDELMQVTEQLELKTKSLPESPASEWTPLDRQMERITKMIEASTRDLSSVQHHGKSRVNYVQSCLQNDFTFNRLQFGLNTVLCLGLHILRGSVAKSLLNCMHKSRLHSLYPGRQAKQCMQASLGFPYYPK